MSSQTHTRPHVSPAKLWFGFAGSAVAWIGLGIADLLITWQACLGEEQYGGAHLDPAAKLIYLIVTVALLITAVVSGVVSFRNWRLLSHDRDLSDAEGRGREEYMALIGVFVCLTLGIGIVWMGLPIAMIELCVRAR